MKPLPAFVRAMPRRAVSRAVGALARVRLPSALVVPAAWLYAKAFGADLSEAARPLSAFRSFGEFFDRELRAGARPMPDDPRAVASPCDGRVHAAARVESGTTLQTKGVPYRIADLLGSEEDARPFEGGSATVLYLAPGDYHRFHWPVDGTIDRVRHLPGDLWPVHPGAVAAVPRLFVRNERVVCLGTTSLGGSFAFVPVGALDVGSIRLAARPLRTNRGGGRRREAAVRLEGSRGDLLGWFELGSAIVLLLAPDAGALDPLTPGARVRVGQAIGRLASPR